MDFFFFFFENQEKELFLVDNTNTERLLRKEQIVEGGEETQTTDLGVAATRPRSGIAINQ